MPLRMPRCTATYPEWTGVIDPVVGTVTSIGTSPRATVRLFQWDPVRERTMPYDRVIDATITEDKRTGVATVVGRSEKMVLEHGIEDGQATIVLTPAKGCKGCQ